MLPKTHKEPVRVGSNVKPNSIGVSLYEDDNQFHELLYTHICVVVRCALMGCWMVCEGTCRGGRRDWPRPYLSPLSKDDAYMPTDLLILARLEVFSIFKYYPCLSITPYWVLPLFMCHLSLIVAPLLGAASKLYPSCFKSNIETPMYVAI